MKILGQLGIIIGIYLLGEFLCNILHLPIPGSILGMLLLLAALSLKLIHVEQLKQTVDFFLEHITFFLIPSGVSIMVTYQVVLDKLIPFFIVNIVATLLVLIATGYTIQAAGRMGKKRIEHKGDGYHA